MIIAVVLHDTFLSFAYRRYRWFGFAASKLETIAGLGARFVGFESLQTMDTWYASALLYICVSIKLCF